MSIMTFFVVLLLCTAVAGMAFFGGVFFVRRMSKTIELKDRKMKVWEQLTCVGTKLNFFYLLKRTNNAAAALKTAGKNAAEAIIVLGEVEEVLDSIEGARDLIDRTRNLANELNLFINFCETTAIPSNDKVLSILEDEIEAAKVIHKRLVADIIQ